MLSKTFGLVPWYLNSTYKKYKGISPIDQLIGLRIEKAKELLLHKPPMPLKDILDTVGLNDQFYFSEVFKSVVGKNPSEFIIINI